MRASTFTHKPNKWFGRLTFIALVLTVTASLSVSTYAQVANQSGDQKERNLSSRNRIAEKGIASLRLMETSPGVSRSESAKPLPNPAPLPPPPGNWAGFYVGGHFGYGWGRANTSFTPLPTAASFINLAPTTLRPDPHGVHGGFQVGSNWVSGSLVGGFETDISWTNMSGTALVTPITQNNGSPWQGTLTAHQDTDWFGTLRARLGGSVGRALIYGTGGLAYAKVNYSANSDFRPQGTIVAAATDAGVLQQLEAQAQDRPVACSGRDRELDGAAQSRRRGRGREPGASPADRRGHGMHGFVLPAKVVHIDANTAGETFA